MKAIEAFIESQGGPEVIDWREVTLGRSEERRVGKECRL